MKQWLRVVYTEQGHTDEKSYRTRNDPLNLASAKDSLVSSGCTITDVIEED